MTTDGEKSVVAHIGAATSTQDIDKGIEAANNENFAAGTEDSQGRMEQRIASLISKLPQNIKLPDRKVVTVQQVEDDWTSISLLGEETA